MADWAVDYAIAIFMANRTWSVGDRMVPTQSDTTTNHAVARGYVWECTTGGTSTGTPAWVTPVTPDVTTVNQNGVVWTARNPTSWANATKCANYLSSQFSGRAASGDTVWIASDHDEQWNVAVNCYIDTSAGGGRRVRYISADKTSGFPPAESATGAKIRQVWGAGFGYGTLLRGAGYFHGVGFESGKAGATTGFDDFEFQSHPTFGTQPGKMEKCSIKLLDSGGSDSSHIMFNTGAVGAVEIEDVDVSFANVNQHIQIGPLIWRGGSILAGSAAITTIFRNPAGYCQKPGLIEGVDFSNAATACNVFNFDSAMSDKTRYTLRNCKLPASWSGNFVNGTIGGHGTRLAMYNTLAGTATYRVWIEQRTGTIRDQTVTLVRSGGATDGATPISWKLVSNANAAFDDEPLECDAIGFYLSSVGAPATATIELLHDSVTDLYDDEIAVELDYLGDAGDTLETIARTKRAKVQSASHTALPSSSATWDTTGMSNPRKQKLSVTFTPQLMGSAIARVFLYKASKTVYVDPKVTLSY